MVRHHQRSEQQAADGVGRDAQAPPFTISRRTALRGAAVGAVVVLVGPKSLAGAGTDDAADGGRWTKGVVKKAGTLEAVMVVVDDTAIIATPVDFPTGWEFRVGDWVGVDIEGRRVCPFLSSAEAVGDHVEHVMPNDRPAQSRRVRRRQVASQSS